MDANQAVEIAKIATGVFGGAIGLEFIKRWWLKRDKKDREPVELTARILDDGDRVREMLFEDNKNLRNSRDSAMERAHAAEIKLTTSEAHNAIIQRRLERKDEANKALVGQLLQLGHVPVIFQPSNGLVQDIGHTPPSFTPDDSSDG